jgi:hypothetical protein
MNTSTDVNNDSSVPRAIPRGQRVHYLDWLRVLAILMVFLFHAVHPFDFGDWQVKNVNQSEVLTIALLLLGIKGCPFSSWSRDRQLTRPTETHGAPVSAGTILSPAHPLHRRHHSVLADRVLLRKHEQDPKRAADFLSGVPFGILHL